MNRGRSFGVAAALTLLPLLGGCSAATRTPVVSVTNTTPQVVGPVTVEVGGSTLDFGSLRSGEKVRISYQPQQASEVVVVWEKRRDTLPRSIQPTNTASLGNDVNILLTQDGAVLDPDKNP